MRIYRKKTENKEHTIFKSSTALSNETTELITKDESWKHSTNNMKATISV